MDLNLKGKVAIVTGGSRGLGFAIAKRLLEEGAKVCITARGVEKLKKAYEELRKIAPDVIYVPADVSVEENVKETYKKVLEHFGDVDILVNNAGNSLVKELVKTTLEEWNSIISVHVTGTFLMSREFVSLLLEKRKRGKIVNIASVSAKSGTYPASAYSAAKSAILGFTKSIAKELARYKVNVNCVCPGAIDTEMFHKGSIETVAKKFNIDPDSLLKSTIAMIPLKRLLKPEEVADLVVFLSSTRSDGITGQCYNIACGLEMGG